MSHASLRGGFQGRIKGEVNLPLGVGSSEERKKRRKEEGKKERRKEKRIRRKTRSSTRSSRWVGGFNNPPLTLLQTPPRRLLDGARAVAPGADVPPGHAHAQRIDESGWMKRYE